MQEVSKRIFFMEGSKKSHEALAEGMPRLHRDRL